jgi:hypothetical protein
MRWSCILLFAHLGLPGCDGCRHPATDETATTSPRYLKGQLHLHSSRSGDSHTSPEDVVRWYREHGFDFVVFTDHNRGGLPIRSVAPLVFSGIELTQNLRSCSPPPRPGDQCVLHMNGLFLDPKIAGFEPWRPEVVTDRRAAYRQALAAATRAGGLVQLNHPNFHHAVDLALLSTLVREDGLRFFEVANGSSDAGNEGDAAQPSTETLWDGVLSAGGWLYGTATDDAHHYDDAAAVAAAGHPVFPPGRGFVMVRAARERESIRAALLRGDFYASTGVMLERIAIVDNALLVEVGVESEGPHTFSFIATGGRVIARMQGRSARVDLTKTPPGYLRAVVEDSQGKKAWVQPIAVSVPAR